MKIMGILAECSKIEHIYDPQRKRPVRRWVLSLPGAGCSWAKESGGCFACGFKHATYKYTKGKLLPPYLFEALYRAAWLSAKKNKPEELWIYNGGSFLNDQEIPPKVQRNITRWTASSNLDRLFVESRPEFVTAHKVGLLIRQIRDKQLMIGIGLECADDEIRNVCVNKGFSRNEYERALEVAKTCGAQVLTYVFLKPTNLSERASVEEAVRTITYAFEAGSSFVALESAFIQKNTVMARLYEERKYNPPWLWSIIEVIQRTHALGPLLVGGFEDNPPPIAIPTNCRKCSKEVEALIQKYRETGDLQPLNNITCECKEKWLQELDR